MRINSEKDFWAGLMFIGFGLAFMLIAMGPPAFLVAFGKQMGWKIEYGYQMGTAVRMGPAYFPTVLGGLLAALGLLVFVRSFFSRLPKAATAVHMAFSFADLLIGVAIYAVLAWASKRLLGTADWGMMAASVLLAVLAFLFRPKAKPMVLIIAACMVFAYLLKPLGLVVSSILLVFVAALGGHEYRTKEVAILAAALAVFSVLVFVKGLTLPFPVWPAFLQ
ncbi:MAG: tripartite tricarboxylate transporter TctB family protein [Burkholderiales bacterium]|nr:tripartite tricarboxylate transporter TctB family protein [Burkholderiales bacterium]